jgi:uncharacterized protein
MMNRSLPWLCLFAVSATAVVAQPSFDCSKAGSSAEELICTDATLAALDRRMAERFAAALDVIATLDAGRDTAESDLRATQRGWIKGRDDCWKADDLAACIREAYETREVELVALWMLEEAMAVQEFVCDGNPANEVTVRFFDTDRPGIRVEYGDSIRAGWLVPAASGSKYALPFGGVFWARGTEALFEWEEGRSMECVAASG